MADGRDFKTANVFMAEGSLLKIGDFGVSKVLSSTLALAKTAIGTPYYISPEICLNRPYNAKVGCASPAGLGGMSLLTLFVKCHCTQHMCLDDQYVCRL